MGRIILRFFYKVWFFGAICFCLSWLFLLVNLEKNFLCNYHRVFSELSAESIDQSLSSSRIEYSRIYRGNVLRRSRRRWSINSLNEQQNFSKLILYIHIFLSLSLHLDGFVSDWCCYTVYRCNWALIWFYHFYLFSFSNIKNKQIFCKEFFLSIWIEVRKNSPLIVCYCKIVDLKFF